MSAKAGSAKTHFKMIKNKMGMVWIYALVDSLLAEHTGRAEHQRLVVKVRQ